MIQLPVINWQSCRPTLAKACGGYSARVDQGWSLKSDKMVVCMQKSRACGCRVPGRCMIKCSIIVADTRTSFSDHDTFLSVCAIITPGRSWFGRSDLCDLHLFCGTAEAGWRFPREQGLQSVCKRPALVVGNYCHDQLLLPGGQQATVLGGAVSYIANVYDALGLDAQVVSKVGSDFAYSTDVLAHPPTVVPGQFTTQFVADLSGKERVLYASHVCDPVYARDLPVGCTFEIGLAAGIAGEILPETIVRLAETSRTVIVDMQSMVRVVDPQTEAVGLCRLEDTPYYDLIPRVSFLKVARDEAPFLDVEAVRKTTYVLVTEGALGCRVFSADSEYRVPAIPAQVLDRTGAGDSFLAGFSAGILLGMPVEKAVLLGNYFGALAVSQVGVPRFSSSQLHAASLL